MLLKVSGQEEDTTKHTKTKSQENKKLKEIYNLQGDGISNQKSLTKKVLRPGGFTSGFYTIHEEKRKPILL